MGTIVGLEGAIIDTQPRSDRTHTKKDYSGLGGERQDRPRRWLRAKFADCRRIEVDKRGDSGLLSCGQFRTAGDFAGSLEPMKRVFNPALTAPPTKAPPREAAGMPLRPFGSSP